MKLANGSKKYWNFQGLPSHPKFDFKHVHETSRQLRFDSTQITHQSDIHRGTTVGRKD